PGPAELEAAENLGRHLRQLRGHHEALSFRKAADEVRAIWRLGNSYLAAAAPWTLVHSDPARAAVAVRTGINLVRVAALAAWPFIPAAAAEVLANLGETAEPPTWTENGHAALQAIGAGGRFGGPAPLF